MICDLHLDHAVGCTSSTSTRTTTHHGYGKKWTKLGNASSIASKVEPRTLEVLENEYSVEVLRTILPVKRTLRDLDTINRVLAVADQIKLSRTMTDSQRITALRYVQQETDKVREYAPILRFDIWMRLRPGVELVVDQTSIHPSWDAYASTTLTYLRDIHQQERESTTLIFFNKGKSSSPAILTAQREKHKKYKPLMDLMRAQAARHTRDNVPTFLAPVISQLGEMSPEAFKLFDLMANTYKSKVTKNRHFMGVSPNEARARFRNRLMTATMANLAVGLGKQLATAGLPSGKRRSTY
jgi:hypothetical protein